MVNVNSIRQTFKDKLAIGEFVIDKTGAKTVEIIGATFVADEPSIFGAVNYEWCKRELEWYLSCSLNVNDIPGKVPAIWNQVSDEDGFINSNYGWCIFSPENGHQYLAVLDTLMKDVDSRRAEMIYTRPSIHDDYNKNGRSDFICTDSVSYFIRNGKLQAHVKMRSNDAIYGFKGDFFWQKWVLDKLACDLDIEAGEIIWTASSLHVYERHFNLVK